MWVVGAMGSGKSSAGRVAADLLEVTFYDTDEVVVERMGCSIAQFWGENGEAAFRDIERVATASLANHEGMKATGGGVVLDEENRKVLSNGEPVVWLKASVETLAARLAEEPGRPLLEGDRPTLETLSSVMAEREQFYLDVSTHVIETDALDVAEVADRLVRIWKS